MVTGDQSRHQEDSAGPKIFAQEETSYKYEHTSGRDLTEKEKGYLYNLTVDLLIDSKAPSGSYTIYVKGKYNGGNTFNERLKKGVAGKVNYLGDAENDVTEILKVLEIALFKPYTDSKIASAYGSGALRILAAPHQDGLPNFKMIINYNPIRDVPPKK